MSEQAAGRGEGSPVRVAKPERPRGAVRPAIKHVCLNHFVAFGERHLEFLTKEYEDHYNTVRPHQGIGNRPIGVVPFSVAVDSPRPEDIQRESRLGGLLRHYWRQAA